MAMAQLLNIYICMKSSPINYGYPSTIRLALARNIHTTHGYGLVTDLISRMTDYDQLNQD